LILEKTIVLEVTIQKNNSPNSDPTLISVVELTGEDLSDIQSINREIFNAKTRLGGRLKKYTVSGVVWFNFLKNKTRTT
jgi:hypothetical protein